VRHREDVAASHVLALLAADRKRIDGLLARALGLLNQGDAAAAVPVLVEEVLAVEPVDGSELRGYCAILSGTLAKHEYREERNLFPLWRCSGAI